MYFALCEIWYKYWPDCASLGGDGRGFDRIVDIFFRLLRLIRHGDPPPPPAPTKKLPRRRIRIQNTTVYQTLTPEEAEEGNEGFTKFLPPVATGRPARTKPRFSFLFGSMTATTAVYSWIVALRIRPMLFYSIMTP